MAVGHRKALVFSLCERKGWIIDYLIEKAFS